MNTSSKRTRTAVGVLVLASWLVAPGEQLRAQAKRSDKRVEAKSSKQSARDAATERALLQQTEKVEMAHLKELEKLATWAASNGLKAEGEKVLETIRGIDPKYPRLTRLKSTVEKTRDPKDETQSPDLRAMFARKLETVGDQNAKRLFDLATACMKLGLFTRAFDLVNKVIEADPDHKRARDILGYVLDPASKKWIRKWEALTARKNFLTEEGWIKKEDKQKWDQGLREYQGKWVSREEEERIRKRNTYNMFSVESEHFRVETNLGRKQGWEYAELLEDFYAEFFRFYLGFFDQAAGANLLFVSARNKKKHLVKVFPTREDYLTFVKAEKNNLKLAVESAGFYASPERCSYFYYADRAETLFTLYHEVTHQLFAETKPGQQGSKGNNWVVEGIASYMETWEKVDGKWKPGHKIASERLQNARQFLAANPNWSLSSFLAVDNEEFHKDGRGLNYALSAALCHFLMHAQGELYREPFIQFISAYYEGKVVEDSLGRFIPVEGGGSASGVISTLETQFKQYMAQLGDSAPGEPSNLKAEESEQ